MTVPASHARLHEPQPVELRRECFNTPLRAGSTGYAHAIQLRDGLGRLAFQSAQAPRLPRELGTFSAPADAYTIAFMRSIDRGIEIAVQAAFARERQAIEAGRRLPITRRRAAVVRNQHPDEAGQIYCFHDTRDALDVVKVGRTIQRRGRRLAQWEATLAPQSGIQLVNLFSVNTRYNVFAERIVHIVLTCENLKRINEHTGQRLDEFFRIGGTIMALKLFLILCVAYVDHWCDSVWNEFRRTSPLFARWQSLGQI